MRKDFITTFITQFVVLVTGVLVYKLAIIFLGKEGFSEYALSRRAISFIQPALLMGLSVGMPRYIAQAQASPNTKTPDTYFLSGLSMLSFFALIFAITLNLLKDYFAFLLFGSSNYAYLIFPISLMLLGLSLHTSCYSYFRGHMQMLRANFLTMVNSAIIPFIVFFVGKSTAQILMLTGVTWLLTSSFLLFLILRNINWEREDGLTSSKELLLYGIQRVPGDFGMAALLGLPAFFTAHIAGIKEAGFVAFGVSLLSMTGAAFAPIGLVLLPKASQLIVDKDFKLLKHYTSKLLKVTVLLTVIGVIFFEAFADEIISLYLGENISDMVLIARIVIIGSLAYTAYVSMRSMIDAYYVKAVNTVNILFSLLLFSLPAVILIFLASDYIYVVICFTVAIFVLGILTLFEIRKVFRRGDYIV